MSDPLSQGMAGSARVMMGHADGLNRIDGTSRGVWTSLWGVAFALAMGLLGSARFHAIGGTDGEERETLAQALVSDAFSTTLAHAAGLALVLVFARARPERFGLYTAAINWSWAVLSAVLLVPFLVFWSAVARQGANGALDGATALFLLAIVVIGIVARYRVVRIVFEMDRSRAASIAGGAFIVEQMVIAGLAT